MPVDKKIPYKTEENADQIGQEIIFTQYIGEQK
jgi:hypothetical protein